MTFLSGWGRRKSKVVSGSTAGAQTNFQLKLTVYKSAGVDTNTEVYLGTNVRDDFGDVRFTDTDETTLLDYWIETITSGVSAVIWIEIATIPASPDSTTIYIYYDNASETTTSNGMNTFNFFDDFSGPSLDTSKWTEYHDLTTQTPGTYTSQSGGILTLKPGTVNQHSSSIVSVITNLPRTSIITFKAKSADAGAYPYVAISYGRGALGYNLGYAHWGLRFYNSYSENRGDLLSKTVNGIDTIINYVTSGWGTYKTYDFILETSQVRVLRDGAAWMLGDGNNLLSGTQQISFSAGIEINGGGILSVDYVYVRKYASPEPTFGATVASSVVNVTSTNADGTYTTGQTINITIQFEELVTITGTPKLELETGAVNEQANYSSGSGGTTITLNYTVQSGDSSLDLDYVAINSLTLNGGTIVDSNNNNATLTLPAPGATGSLGANKNIVISTVTPANITATGMTITQSETPCRVGICTVTVNVTWTNTGGSAGTFTPSMTIDGTPVVVTPPLNPVTVNPTETVSQQFTVSGLTAGTHTICPVPN